MAVATVVVSGSSNRDCGPRLQAQEKRPSDLPRRTLGASGPLRAARSLFGPLHVGDRSVPATSFEGDTECYDDVH